MSDDVTISLRALVELMCKADGGCSACATLLLRGLSKLLPDVPHDAIVSAAVEHFPFWSTEDRESLEEALKEQENA